MRILAPLETHRLGVRPESNEQTTKGVLKLKSLTLIPAIVCILLSTQLKAAPGSSEPSAISPDVPTSQSTKETTAPLVLQERDVKIYEESGKVQYKDEYGIPRFGTTNMSGYLNSGFVTKYPEDNGRYQVVTVLRYPWDAKQKGGGGNARQQVAQEAHRYGDRYVARSFMGHATLG